MVIRPANTKHIKNSALIGMILGDGSIQREKFLYLRHGSKQLGYVDEKIDYLKKYIMPKSVRTCIDKQGFRYRYAYYNEEKLKYLYNLIYKKRKGKMRKSITSTLLNRFTDVSLAFFYMDDGCLSLRKYKKNGIWQGTYKSREIHLNVQSFNFAEAEMFKNMLKRKFDVEFRMTTDRGNPRLWCNTKNTKKMIEIVKPIVSQFMTMQYKLDLKYNT